MHAEEIEKLLGNVERAGSTRVPLDLHSKGGRIELEVGLAKGKKLHDRRKADRDRDWKREQQRLMKTR